MLNVEARLARLPRVAPARVVAGHRFPRARLYSSSGEATASVTNEADNGNNRTVNPPADGSGSPGETSHPQPTRVWRHVFSNANLSQIIREIKVERRRADADNDRPPVRRHGAAPQSPPRSATAWSPLPLEVKEKSHAADWKPIVRGMTELRPAAEHQVKKKKVASGKKGRIPEDVSVVNKQHFQLNHIDIGNSEAPTLAHGLDRVLFNPGVYYLQDPRSRVYNFDPYLQHIMPAKEFNYDALTGYIIPSKDRTLENLARAQNLRYYSSSSNMTCILEHFHFLLSHWRELNFSMLSQKFRVDSRNFSKFTRTAKVVFLRWRNGVYAVDKSKDDDSANIFSVLGRSLEKLLVLPAEDYETYRRSSAALSARVDEVPEGYHFSSAENILLRSQLDAKDPRMPGTGVFDIKTRAVLSLRHAPQDRWEDFLGYELQMSRGQFLSYEREFHDMVRAAMLKYSLQVRIGRMDGIFVAYHNIERIFGFQYVSLAEMDEALHGQQDPSLGDQEFGVSLKMINDIFDRATARFPEQSLRLSFETREGVQPFMYVFAEPVEESEIEDISKAAEQRQADFEKSLFGEDGEGEGSVNSGDWAKIQDSVQSSMDSEPEQTKVEEEDGERSRSEKKMAEETADRVAEAPELEATTSTKRDQEAPEPTEEGDAGHPPLIGFTVTVRNVVNGQPVTRPERLTSEDSWRVEYHIAELKAAAARKHYTLLKRRRAKANAAPSPYRMEQSLYFRRIRQYVEESRTWRSRQDHLDRGREPVVFQPWPFNGEGVS